MSTKKTVKAKNTVYWTCGLRLVARVPRGFALKNWFTLEYERLFYGPSWPQ
jgi:hypothetical protein